MAKRSKVARKASRERDSTATPGRTPFEEAPATRPAGSIDLVLLGICLLSLGIRLIGMTQPLVDEQAWRQTETAAVARNYFEEGYDLLDPRVDWRGDTPGFVEMEFPLYQFLVACLYRLGGGAQEWMGHLVSTVFSTATVPLLYLLTRAFYGIPAARIAAMVFAVAPLNAFFGRAFMPESAMLFFSVGAVYFFDRWLNGARRWAFATATLCGALSFLIKLPTLYLGLPLLYLSYARFRGGLLRRPGLWMFAALTLLPTVLWYKHAYDLFEQTHLTYGIWNRYGYAKWGNLDLLASGGFYLLVLERLGGVTLTPVGLALMVIGAAMRMGSPREAVFHVWLLALILYVLVVPEGNKTLNYYQLPFVPVGAIFIGKALGRFWEGHACVRGVFRSAAARQVAVVVCVTCIAVLAYAYAAPLFAPQPYETAQYEIGREVDALLPKEALLVVGDSDVNADAPYRTQNPTLLYYCHRKGWQLLPRELEEPGRLRSLIQRGARFVLVPGFVFYNPREASVSMLLYDFTGRQLARFDKHVP